MAKGESPPGFIVAIEEVDDMTAIDPEVRDIVARNRPHLLAKLPPED